MQLNCIHLNVWQNGATSHFYMYFIYALGKRLRSTTIVVPTLSPKKYQTFYHIHAYQITTLIHEFFTKNLLKLKAFSIVF